MHLPGPWNRRSNLSKSPSECATSNSWSQRSLGSFTRQTDTPSWCAPSALALTTEILHIKAANLRLAEEKASLEEMLSKIMKHHDKVNQK